MAKKKKKKPAAASAPGAKPVAMVRVRRITAAAAAPTADPGVPVAVIAAAGGPVVVGITFGQAQLANYAIQLFDPSGTTERTRERGMNTDAIPEQFTLSIAPAALDQHILQWSGVVSAFSPAPGQQFSVTFDVTQNGVGVAGGRVQRSGPLNVAQAFVGVLRLVTR